MSRGAAKLPPGERSHSGPVSRLTQSAVALPAVPQAASQPSVGWLYWYFKGRIQQCSVQQ